MGIKILIYFFALITFPLVLFGETLLCTQPQTGIFADAQPLDWTIQADFLTINNHDIEYSQREKAQSKGQLTSSQATSPVIVKARGNSRYQDCLHRPMEVSLENGKKDPHNPFWGQKKVRLIPACSSSHFKEFEAQRLLKEYTLYKIQNQLTGPSLQVRQIHLTLKNLDGSLHYQGPAYVRESAEALAVRCKMRQREDFIRRWNSSLRTFQRLLEMKDGSLRLFDYDYDRESSFRMHFWNYLINNPDFSIEEDRNIFSLAPLDETIRKVFWVAYDFDLSQAADGYVYSFGGDAKSNAVGLAKWLNLPFEDVSPSYVREIVQDFVKQQNKILSELKNAGLNPESEKALFNWTSTHIKELEIWLLTQP